MGVPGFLAACAGPTQTPETANGATETNDPLERAEILYEKFKEEVYLPKKLSPQESSALLTGLTENGWANPVHNPELGPGESSSEIPQRTVEEIDKLVKEVVFPKILKYPTVEYYPESAKREIEQMKADCGREHDCGSDGL